MRNEMAPSLQSAGGIPARESEQMELESESGEAILNEPRTKWMRVKGKIVSWNPGMARAERTPRSRANGTTHLFTSLRCSRGAGRGR